MNENDDKSVEKHRFRDKSNRSKSIISRMLPAAILSVLLSAARPESAKLHRRNILRSSRAFLS